MKTWQISTEFGTSEDRRAFKHRASVVLSSNLTCELKFHTALARPNEPKCEKNKDSFLNSGTWLPMNQ